MTIPADTARPIPDDPFLTVEQVAPQIGAARSTVYRLTHRGDLGHVRVGRYMKWRQSQVDAFLAAATVSPR